MKQAFVGVVLLGMLVCAGPFGQTQQSAAANTSAAVPTLVKFSGMLIDLNRKPLSGVVGVTFLLYKDEQGGAPLWMETQNVTLDKSGQYSVMLGSTRSAGLPTDLFASGEARWLAVQPQGQTEQTRVLLLSVPYALKAGDAATVGGLPPSAFVLATPASGISTPAATGDAAATSASVPPPTTSNVTTTGGTANRIPLFTTATNVQNSILTQVGTTSLSVGGSLVMPATGTATSTAGKNSQPESFVASVFNSGTATAVNQKFQWQAEPANNDKTTASGTLNLLYASGTATPAETGFKINSKGLVTFATGQTFPGTGSGTVKSVGLSAPASDFTVSGSPVTSTGTLNFAWNVAPTSANTVNAIVKRDASGNFNGGSISANALYSGSLTLSNYLSMIGTEYAYYAGNASTVWGIAAASTGAVVGVEGDTYSNTSNAYGVYGNATSGGTGVAGFGATGVQGQSTLCCVGPGGLFAGFTASSGSNASGTDGVDATGGSGDPSTISNGGAGVRGTGGNGAISLFGSDGPGGWFQGGNNASFGDGIEAYAGSGGTAGYFSGDILVTGTIYAGTKDFKIDHPLDPANKYLVHASVESSERMNIYTGNVTTDAEGEASVQLPNWFEALNTDFRYQLTVIGQFAQAIVAREIENHEFRIRTNAPNVKVSWQVTGVRQDAFAKAHPLVVEEEKDARLRGFYLHPELHGAPEEKQIEWARHPEMMKRMKEHRVPPIKTAAPAHIRQASR